MPTAVFVEPHIESLMEILFAQCNDLEALLALAQRETGAAQQHDFDQILEVVKQRATVGDRLEVYHRQLAELRARLGEALDPALNNPVVARTLALVATIKLQDDHTRPMLIAARGEALKQSLRVDRAQRNLGAYTRKGQAISIACDKHI